MKGIIFTELLNFVESKGGPLFLEQVIAEAKLPNNGAFSTVATYPSQYANALVQAASQLSSIPAQQLCREYGEFLFHRFTVLYPELLAAYKNADQILSHVGTHIHQEVKLLDPEAKPPQVSTREEDGALIIEYQSHRPFAHIAHGLICGALAHYKDPRKLLAMTSDDPSRATFKVVA
ncbi:guanylate cyclase [Altererythrobacter indicus]|uniref:Guanylate cyclase n=1 Tax=Altericroceibacterium indicum TaxID=374177 RepID=A0A845ABY0_9SPHN|nr:heme NO-binding domain-containing protein [Altericroceibacterium indicum]MXP26056.1 guanylate cyclase [Altericroceibacterium indicum]